MIRGPELWIALRYLRARRGERFISLIGWLSTGGVALGVAALIVVFSVMTGYQEALRDKIVGVNAHVAVYPLRAGALEAPDEVAARAASVEGVASVSPFVLAQAMFAARGSATGAVLRGVRPEDAAALSAVSAGLEEGDLKSLAGGTPSLFLGRELARTLNVKTGDAVQVTIPVGDVPRMRAFRVAGVFSLGMYEYDSGLAVTSLAAAQEFLDIGAAAAGLEIRVDDLGRALEVASRLSETLGGDYWVADWQKMNRNMFAALELQRVVLALILSLIVFVAAFNVTATLLLVVIEKTREIGILKAMGAGGRTLMRIFAFQGIVVGGAGAAAGTALGLLLCALLARYPIVRIPSDIYLFDRLPVSVRPIPCLLFALGAVVLCWAAALLPARIAARMDPVRAIRIE